MSKRSGSETRRRNASVNLRLTPKEDRRLRARAHAAKMSLQDYMRRELRVEDSDVGADSSNQ